VNHGTVRKLVGLLVAVAFCATFIVAPASAGTIAPVTATTSSSAAGAANTSYTFAFSLPGGLVGSEYMTVGFPSGYEVSHITSSTVTCYGGQGWVGSVDDVNVSGQNVGVSISTTFAAGEPVTLTFLGTSQISNPAIPSTYSFTITTPRDSGSASVAIGIGATVPGGTGAGGVTGVAVTVSHSNAGKVAEYMITFSLASESLLFPPNDYVDIQFPAGSTLPTNVTIGTVLMRNAPVTAMSVSDTRLRLWIPGALGPFADCSVLVMQSAGILHPELPGTYVVQVATSKQVNYSSSNGYPVIGTAVVNPSVVVNPARQGMAAQYQLTFTSSPSGALGAGTGRIVVEFPAGTTIPGSLPPSSVRINDVAAVSVLAIAATKIAITIPADVSAGSTMRVVFGIDLGIRNPSVVGTYQLGISTSGDTAPGPVSYSVSSSQIGAVTAQVGNSAAGKAAAYTIAFATGPGGAMAAGIDRINVEFPAGTTIPVSLAGSSATVNGTPSTLATTAGMIISVTIPASIAANSLVSLVITETVGIMNPVIGGTYTVRVSTSRETIAVTSTGYAVSSLPVVTAIVTPSAPDGQHGYYRTKPMITLTAQSVVDTQPIISYYFDTNSASVYGGQPLTALEGTHTLTYFATDRLGSRSENGTWTIAVDSIAPVIALTTPRDGEVMNSASFVVQGTVDVGSTVQINGQLATVDATGAFTAPLTIQGTSATVVVDATDVAGNTAHTTVSVTVDKAPPTLTVSQPVNFQKIQRLPIVVAGKTEVGAVVTVNGAAAQVLADGSVEYFIANAADGPLTITVIARDAAGNATTRSIVVTVLSTKLIQMLVGAKAALVNGQSVVLQTAPVIKNGATLVPLRFVAETFGISPVWDGVFQIIDLPLGTRTVRLQIGQRFAAVDGKRVALDAAPVILGGVTMVPLRFIADMLGADTQWEASTRTIIIVYPRAS
jgi:hypothetical protein